MKGERAKEMPGPGVWPLGARSGAALERWADEHGHRFVAIRVERSADRRALLVAIGQAFAFPAWYGANLDALYDSLTDLPEHAKEHANERAGPPGCVATIEGVSSREARDRHQPVLDVFADAARELARQGYELRVFVAQPAAPKSDA